APGPITFRGGRIATGGFPSAIVSSLKACMVGSKRRHRTALAASHQRAWLKGRHAVLETLAHGRWRPLAVRSCESLDSDTRQAIQEATERAGIEWTEHPGSR